MSHPDDLLRPADVCRRLRVSRSWLYAAAASGRIPSIRLGGPEGPLRFVSEDVEAWMERARQGWQPAESSRQTLARATRQLEPR